MGRVREVYDMVLADKSGPGTRGFVGNLSLIDRKTAALAVGGVAALGAAGVATFTALYNAQAPLIDAVGKLSESTGIGVERIQAMQDAAERAGVPINALNGSMLEGLKRISEAAGGAGEAGKILAELGLSAEELRQQKPADQITDILTALEGVENVNDRIKFADKIFGGQGVELIRLTSGAINEAEQDMRDLDLALNEINVGNVEALNDQLQLVSRYSGQSAKVFTAEMAPAISGVIDGISGLGQGLGSVRTASSLVADVLAKTAGFFLDSFQGIRIIINGIQLGFEKAALAAAKFYARFDDSAKAYYDVFLLSESVSELSKELDALRSYKPSDAIEASLAARRAEVEIAQGELDATNAALAKAESERRAAEAARLSGGGGGILKPGSQGDAIETQIQREIEREAESAKRKDDSLIAQIQRETEIKREARFTEEQLLLEEQQRMEAILDGIAARDISRTDEVNTAKQAANQEFHDEYLQLIAKRAAEQDKREQASMKKGRDYIEQGIAHFAGQSEVADALHKALTARRMFREGREAVIGAYKWGNSIGGPAVGSLLAGIAGGFTAALIAETVGGSSPAPAAPTGGTVYSGISDLNQSASNAAQNEATPPQTIIYNAYFPSNYSGNKDADARKKFDEDVKAKRIVVGENIDVQVNVFDYEDYGT